MGRENPALILEGTKEKPDYDQCIKISTESSLREMVLPGLLVILSPILTGILFGIEGVCGLLVGGLTSGVQLAISQSNAGGAWDNAKKYVECGKVILATKCPLGQAPEVDALDNTVSVYYRHGKKSEVHKSAVVGDTVGDPLKDTSGPALNILMKLMAIISLVFADFFCGINNGQGLLKTS